VPEIKLALTGLRRWSRAAKRACGLKRLEQKEKRREEKKD
jgi:hypothetical protein